MNLSFIFENFYKSNGLSLFIKEDSNVCVINNVFRIWYIVWFC